MVKIFLAGERDGGSDINLTGLWKKAVKRRLFSAYHHVNFEKNRLSKSITDAEARGWECFLDSGAFSFAQDEKKSAPPLEYYAKVYRAHGETFSVFAPLDVIGKTEASARATFRNYKRLRYDLGVPVPPVYHIFEPNYWLIKNIEEAQKNDTLLCLGGIADNTASSALKWRRLEAIFSMHEVTDRYGYPRLPIHGFGVGDENFIKRFPFASVDATSWLSLGIEGGCKFRKPDASFRDVYFSPEARTKNKRPHFDVLGTSAREIVTGWLARFELTPEDVAKGYIFCDIVNAATFQGMEDLGTERFVRHSLAVV